MRFELDLLENSYDYVKNSIELYRIADEYGNHDEQRSNLESKVKWKLAFVTMVQACELLLKEILSRIQTNLIYDDIDAERIDESKTVSFHQAINRINNFREKIIDDKKIPLLIRCSKLRNEFIHYKVSISSEHIMSLYSSLYLTYKELHLKLIGEELIFKIEPYISVDNQLIHFASEGVVFRGRAMTKSQMEEFKAEQENNARYNYYFDNHGRKTARIKFGDEINRVSEEYRQSNDMTIYKDYDICDDCLAKKGEYHLMNCDLEICPFCFGQLMTCSCVNFTST